MNQRHPIERSARARSEWSSAVAVALVLAACGGADQAGETGTAESGEAAAGVPAGPDERVRQISGFAGPEAVRHDGDLDVWFVSNFDGPGDERDGNGFISRIFAGEEGEVAIRFITAADEPALHAPRGMYIVADTLWVADIDGVHGFLKSDGSRVAFVDLTSFEPGFLNDVAAGPAGALYVTDTGASRIYRIDGREASVVVADSLLGPPNGITWDAEVGRFLLAPWGGVRTLRAWRPGADTLEVWATSEDGGFFDGVEVVGDRVLVASQADSAVHVVEGGATRPLIRVPGAPADIGVDRGRGLVAVPYIAENRVDIWAIPGR